MVSWSIFMSGLSFGENLGQILHLTKFNLEGYLIGSKTSTFA